MWRGTLDELAAAIRAHPRFPEASRLLVKEILDRRIRLGVLNKVISNLGRERIIEHLLFLHFAHNDDVLRHGATFERLAALSDRRDQFGARAVRTALRLAQIGGLLSLARSRQDARLRIFEPTQALLGLVREHYAAVIGVFDVLFPDENIGIRLREDPNFLPALLARGGQAWLSESPPQSGVVDPFSALLRLEGGRPILTTVVDCHWSRRELPTNQELAQRFHVSSSQARVILKSAQANGLVRLGPRGRLLDAAPLVELYLQSYSRYLAFFARYGLSLEARLLSEPRRRSLPNLPE